MPTDDLLAAAQRRASLAADTVPAFFDAVPARKRQLRQYLDYLVARGIRPGAGTVRKDCLAIWPDLPGSESAFRRFLVKHMHYSKKGSDA